MDAPSIANLVERARRGDQPALAELFELHQPRLLRMVELRIDPSLRRRLDPVDIVQEAWTEVLRRFPEWTAQDALPFHVWLRLIAAQSLLQALRGSGAKPVWQGVWQGKNRKGQGSHVA